MCLLFTFTYMCTKLPMMAIQKYQTAKDSRSKLSNFKNTLRWFSFEIIMIIKNSSN